MTAREIVDLPASVEQARPVFHIDVGFGDPVVPQPVKAEYPVILDMPAPVLLTYSRESAIAEKVEAMVRLGPANSRMKDFYDVWLLSSTTSFDGEVLSTALRRTLENRRTAVPNDLPGFLESIAAEPGKQQQWNVFLERGALTDADSRFEGVVEDISSFLVVPYDALLSGDLITKHWSPGGPWM